MPRGKKKSKQSKQAQVYVPKNKTSEATVKPTKNEEEEEHTVQLVEQKSNSVPNLGSLQTEIPKSNKQENVRVTVVLPMTEIPVHVDSWQHFITLLQLDDTERAQTLLTNLNNRAPPSFLSTFDQPSKTTWLKKAGFSEDEIIDLLYQLRQNGNFPAPASSPQPQVALKESSIAVAFANTLAKRTNMNLSEPIIDRASAMHALGKIIPSILMSNNLVLDEIQVLNTEDPKLLPALIQIASNVQIAARYSLVLVGTPNNGHSAVDFDDNTKGRLVDFLVPNFSPPEIFAILTKTLRKQPSFDVFMALWSCFEGVPGWYQKAYEEGVFTADTYDAEKLKEFTRRRLRLQPEEETYISGISRQHGRAYNPAIDKNNPILEKLLNNGILGYGKSQHLFVIDPVVFAAIECRDDVRTPAQIIQNLKGFGFESIVNHMAKDILTSHKVTQELFPNVTVFLSKVANIVTEKAQELSNQFFALNIVVQMICIVLAEKLKVSQEELLKLAKSQMERWQYIQRGSTTSALKKMKDRGSNVISVRGARRVGKTTLIAHVYEKALFIDCKVLD